MPNSAALTQRIAVLGDTYDFSQTIESDMAPRMSVELTAAKTGTLTTRTSNTVGTLTLQAGHGVTTGALLDIYWPGGRRFQVTVGTVATNSVPFTLGQGDNLPVLTTAVKVMVPHPENLVAVAADIVVAAAKCVGAPATVVFCKADGTFITALKTGDTEPVGAAWATGLQATPFTQDVGHVYFSHGDSTAPRTITGVVMYN